MFISVPAFIITVKSSRRPSLLTSFTYNQRETTPTVQDHNKYLFKCYKVVSTTTTNSSVPEKPINLS